MSHLYLKKVDYYWKWYRPHTKRSGQLGLRAESKESIKMKQDQDEIGLGFKNSFSVIYKSNKMAYKMANNMFKLNIDPNLVVFVWF